MSEDSKRDVLVQGKRPQLPPPLCDQGIEGMTLDDMFEKRRRIR